MIPVEDFPIVFVSLVLPVPSVLSGIPAPTINIRVHTLRVDMGLIRKKYGRAKFAMPSTNVEAFCRMLAKIAHSFAVAELGLNYFSPALIDYILSNTEVPAFYSHIGGFPQESPPSDALHEIELYNHEQYPYLVMVRLRLFAKYNGPSYLIVVGEKKREASG